MTRIGIFSTALVALLSLSFVTTAKAESCFFKNFLSEKISNSQSLRAKIVDIRGIDPVALSLTPQEKESLTKEFREAIQNAPSEIAKMESISDCSNVQIHLFENELGQKSELVVSPDFPTAFVLYVLVGPHKLKAINSSVHPNLDVQVTTINYFVWGPEAAKEAAGIQQTDHLKLLFPGLIENH